MGCHVVREGGWKKGEVSGNLTIIGGIRSTTVGEPKPKLKGLIGDQNVHTAIDVRASSPHGAPVATWAPS